MSKSVLAKTASLAAKAQKQAESKLTSVQDVKNRELSQNSVTKTNQLARAYYRFDLVSKRLMESLISKLNPLAGVGDLQPITINAKDYAKTFNVSPKHAYNDLEKAAKTLLRSPLRVEHMQNGDYEEYGLAIKAEYRKGSGSLTVTLNPLITPHLLSLRNKQHIKYPLKEAVNFSSSYTWRLYEILLSQRKSPRETNGLIAGEWTYEVEEIRKLLSIPDSYVWSNINKMLIKSIEEIETETDLKITIERLKTARKITHVNFKFKESKPKA